ncbi:hypothetical protein ZHAS_00009861 [Anopheles sinensis]|uniref:Uncharacterized protein n=1 Tax=Anopheles sinensis TaxID=74873 RepID=A0A084VW47_ANOSI|nr:hypothetical protein ZHAS_00009861 [Anopheles sinensis]
MQTAKAGWPRATDDVMLQQQMTTATLGDALAINHVHVHGRRRRASERSEDEPPADWLHFRIWSAIASPLSLPIKSPCAPECSLCLEWWSEKEGEVADCTFSRHRRQGTRRIGGKLSELIA